MAEMDIPENAEVMTIDLSTRIVRDYVCSECYGQLLRRFVKAPAGKAAVYCPKCGGGKGFVTRTWADTQRVQSHYDLAEVKRNLGNLLGIPEDKRSEGEILSDLGF